MPDTKDFAEHSGFKPYQVGDCDTRPWGSYTVTAVGKNAAGEEICEKEIRVDVGQVLSLQSHTLRREYWKVIAGQLTVLVDDRKITLSAGQDIHIPTGAIHCMANLSSAVCVVREVQEGICREDDITRYIDAYGRSTEDITDDKAAACVALYQDILASLGKTLTSS
jgi:mannose-6-phosphate isomerase